MSRTSKLGRSIAPVAGTWGAFALAVALVLAFSWPQSAWGYFAKPAPTISVAGSVAVSSGAETSISCAVSPTSEVQLPGCGMAECPQACDGLTNPSTGVAGGCLNADGWCTCAGTMEQTAYTNVSVASSDPSICRASWAGGVLSVAGYREGSATLTIRATLSKHNEAVSYVTVNVSGGSSSVGSGSQEGGAASGSGSGAGSSSGASGSSSGSSSSAPSSGSASASSGNGGSGGDKGTSSVEVVPAGSGATAYASAAVSSGEAQETEQDAVEIKSPEGALMVVVEAGDASVAAAELQKVAGTDGTCTFWAGGTMDAPLVSWTFKGQDLDPAADLSFDPQVQVSRLGSGAVLDLMSTGTVTDRSLVLEFSHTGALPAPAEVYVRTSGSFEDGAALGLFLFDEEAQAFKAVEGAGTGEGGAVVASDGYAVFTLDHCSTWAVADWDLAALSMPEAPAAAAEPQAAATDATQVNTQADSAAPFLAGVAVVLVLAGALGAAMALSKRKRDAAVLGEDVPQAAVAEPADGEPADA